MIQTYDKQTYRKFLSSQDILKIKDKIAEQSKLIGVKVTPEEIKVPTKWPELERFMADKENILTQKEAAKKATQLPLLHPVMRATILALEGAGVITEEHQGKLLEVVGKMVDDEISAEITKLEKKLRDDKFKVLYGQEVERRVLIERAHKTFKEYSAMKKRSEDEEMLLLESMCAILLDGDLAPLNKIYDELNQPKKNEGK